MIGKSKTWMCVTLMALAMSASAFIPRFQPLETFFPDSGKNGVNFYTYVDGNPLNAIDPEGLCARPSLFGRTSLFGGKTYSSLRTSSPSWLKPMQSDFRRQQRYGTPFEDRLRGTMAPAVAAASVFNPAAIGRGIANDYWGNYKASGSHYNAANLTFNPVVRGFLNTSQATDGIGYKYHNSGSRLSTGQRVASGIGAAFNAAESVGIGYVGAKLTTSLAPSLNRSSFSFVGRNQAAVSIRNFRADMRAVDMATTDINSYVRSFEPSSFRYSRNLNPFKKFYRHYNVDKTPGGPWLHDNRSLLQATPFQRRSVLALPYGSEATGTAWTRVPFGRRTASGIVAPQTSSFTGLPAEIQTGGARQWFVPGTPYLDFTVIP